MNVYSILLGSNLGKKLCILQRARILISLLVGRILKYSSIYETEPWGESNQDTFLNQALILASDLTPSDLLYRLQAIEKILGKNKTTRWGPRTIDIDILLSEEKIIQENDLSVPHPRMTDRKFVLIPLAEISGDQIHPIHQCSINELLLKCQDEGQVVKMKSER